MVFGCQYSFLDLRVSSVEFSPAQDSSVMVNTTDDSVVAATVKERWVNIKYQRNISIVNPAMG